MMKKNLSRILRYGAILATLGFIISVLLQLFARFFLPTTPAWTEEASRLFFIYAIAFAAGPALRDGAYISLDTLYQRIPPSWQRWLAVGLHAVTVLLFGCMTVFSVPMVLLGHAEWSSSMPIRMSLAFGSIFMLALSMTYFAWSDLRRALSNARPTEGDVTNLNPDR